LETVNRSMVR